MKIAVCNELFVGCSAVASIESAAQIGYDGVELAPYTLSDDIAAFPVGSQREIAACARENGIAIVGMHWLLAKPEGLHVASADVTVRRRTRDVFRKLIEITTNIGGRILTFGSPQQRSSMPGMKKREATDRLVGFFQDLVPEFQAANVVLALEPLETEFTNMINSTAEACDIADAIGSDLIGITLDTHFLRWECRVGGGTMLDAFRRAGDRLAHLHIQDDNFRAPGSGTADFAEFIHAVRAVSWNNWLSLETIGIADAEAGCAAAKEGIAFMRRHFDSEGGGK